MVLNETAELLGLSLRMTEDQITRDMLSATATQYDCVGGFNGDVPSNISLSDFDNVTSALLTNDAWMILDSIGGEDRQICPRNKSSLIDLELVVAIS